MAIVNTYEVSPFVRGLLQFSGAYLNRDAQNDLAEQQQRVALRQAAWDATGKAIGQVGTAGLMQYADMKGTDGKGGNLTDFQRSMGLDLMGNASGGSFKNAGEAIRQQQYSSRQQERDEAVYRRQQDAYYRSIGAPTAGEMEGMVRTSAGQLAQDFATGDRSQAFMNEMSQGNVVPYAPGAFGGPEQIQGPPVSLSNSPQAAPFITGQNQAAAQNAAVQSQIPFKMEYTPKQTAEIAHLQQAAQKIEVDDTLDANEKALAKAVVGKRLSSIVPAQIPRESPPSIQQLEQAGFIKYDDRRGVATMQIPGSPPKFMKYDPSGAGARTPWSHDPRTGVELTPELQTKGMLQVFTEQVGGPWTRLGLTQDEKYTLAMEGIQDYRWDASQGEFVEKTNRFTMADARELAFKELKDALSLDPNLTEDQREEKIMARAQRIYNSINNRNPSDSTMDPGAKAGEKVIPGFNDFVEEVRNLPMKIGPNSIYAFRVKKFLRMAEMAAANGVLSAEQEKRASELVKQLTPEFLEVLNGTSPMPDNGLRSTPGNFDLDAFGLSKPLREELQKNIDAGGPD